jgi:peptidoglycan/xylan/chitin deacetylase (PgdA/CDA1 family)
MFHGVLGPGDAPPADREEGAHLYDLDVATFRTQLEHLRAARVRVLSADDNGEGVRLTFDDGEANNATRALPALEDLGMRATFFVTPRRIGRPGYMTWEQVKHLRASGMDVGAHGLTHRVLVGLGEEDLRAETAGARHELEAGLGGPVTAFSVPRGFYDDRVLGALQGAGYHKVFVSRATVRPGDVVERVAVKAGWGVQRFAMAAAGRVPMRERGIEMAREGAKRMLGPSGYNRLRGVLLRVRGG